LGNSDLAEIGEKAAERRIHPGHLPRTFDLN
jgi:hypothetical protein